MASHFLTAKYQSDVIQKGFSKAYHTDRNTLLITDRSLKTDEEEDKVFLITTYHPNGRILGSIVNQNWDMLDKSSSTREVLDWKIVQGFRRPKNIRDILVRALVRNPMDVADKPPKHLVNKCSRKNCRYCLKLDTSGRITSPITGRSYNTIRCCSCKTNNIIYCITCKICKKQYIGHTKRTLSDTIENIVSADTTILRTTVDSAM